MSYRFTLELDDSPLEVPSDLRRFWPEKLNMNIVNTMSQFNK